MTIVDSVGKLVNSDEDSTMYLSGLADTRVTLGNALHATGDMDRQLSFYIKASADYLELIRARPGVPRYHSNLVAAQTNIAQVLYRRGDAIAAIEKLAVALQQVEALPDSPEKVEQGAYVRVTFGQILRDSGGDADETESAFGSADKLCTDLVQFRPDHSPYRVLHGEVKNNVGVHYLLGNDFEKAEVAFKSALADFDKALELNKGDVAASHGRAWCLNYLADTLYELSRKDQAAKLYKEAIKLRAALCRDNPHNVEYQYAQAWLLLTCQDRSFRDALAGSRIADRLSASMPENGRFLVLKSLGQLRSEDYFGVIKTLNAAVKYRLSYKTPADFIRAMALWLNEDQKGAEAAWKSANNTMERYAPADIKLRRLRAESAELLEIPAPVAPAPEGGESGSAN